jgi:hypothetical protein
VGAAWPPVERPSNCLDSAVGRPARWQVASPPSRVPRVPPPATRFAVRAASWCQDVRMPTVTLSALSASACPASVRPVSGACPASARPVSSARCPRMRCPRVRFPMSGCGRPVSRVGVRAFRVRVRRVCTRDFVKCVGARTITRPRKGQVWPSCCIRGRLDHLPEPTGLKSGVSGIASGALFRSEAATTLRGHRGRSGAESPALSGAF